MNIKILCLFFVSSFIYSQTIVTSIPAFPTQTDKITINFNVTNATHANKIAGYTGQAYAHTGVTLVTGTGTPNRWQNVIGSWGNTAQPKLTMVSYNNFQIVIDNPRSFYNVINTSQKITEICIVIRSEDGSKQSEDIFIPIFSPGISILLTSPSVNRNFGDASRSPVFVNEGGTIPISASASELGTKAKSITLYVNGTVKFVSISNTLNYTFAAKDYSSSKNEVKIIVADTSNIKDSTSFVIIKNPAVKNLPLPAGNIIGINYNSNSQVTLALYAPNKNFVYVISDLSDWKVDEMYFMNRYEVKPDSIIWWTTVSNLTSGKEYAYQFLVDGEVRVADPYADKFLDNSNDKYISTSVYPNLMSYPSGKTEQLVSVLQTGQAKYNWKQNTFTRPAKEKLVIYELHVRDFVSTHSYKTVKDTLSYFKKLGINAIELMPINEFEGNSSWGFNPSFYFAPDKYYGTKDDLKALIDACHENGIAVLLDIVLNHSYGANSMVRMYFNSSTGKPSADNPWFNQQSNFANPDAQWGYDFNHESKATQYFVDRVIQYWLTEFKVDGFRFDFTKGFGNNPKPATGDVWGSNYDADRIRLLKRMVNKAWTYDPTAIMILEHLAENREEIELSNAGMLLWGNINSTYSEAALGYYDSNNKSNFELVSYKVRGWNQPNLVGYMESHDEERLMYKNYQYGNSFGNYSIKNPETALQRMKLVGAFFFTVPGPKMIWQFGEIGYDISINSGGRLSEKPLKWNYYQDPSRNRLFKVWSSLINLKKNYPAFSSSDFRMTVNGYLKRMWINHSSMNIAIVGNFGVVKDSLWPEFQSFGKWYDYFTGDELNVTKPDQSVELEPGEFKIYSTVKLPTPEKGILSDIKSNGEIPSEFKLEQNYPNPFNPTTVISYQLSAFSHVTLKVFDVLGREVATLVNEYQSAGERSVEFRVKNGEYSSGLYFYQLKAGSYIETKKMVLIK